MLTELGISISYFTQRQRPIHGECEDLVSIGFDIYGREQWLEQKSALAWQAMLGASAQEGVMLQAVSGFRSFDYQRKIIERKLASGLTVEQIIRVSALPGFSEHHTGRAIDISTPGCPPVTESFEMTIAFDWMVRRGRDFGFSMTYPRNNEYGVVFEPWHWLFRDPNQATGSVAPGFVATAT
jgi:D-alanyl-D-alanine carboxypeptidase